MQVSRNQYKGPLAPAPESFLERAVELEKHSRTNAALDLIYDAIDELLRTDRFAEVDSLLVQLSARDFSVDLLLGLLTVTLPAKSRLPSRERFFHDVEQNLKVRGEFAEGLLTGLK